MIRHFETAFAVFTLFFLTGSTVTLLTPSSALIAYGSTGSPMVRALALLIGVISVGLFALHRGAINHLLTKYWPVMLAPAFAVISIFWAADIGLSFRRGAALIFVTLFAIWLAERFTTRTIINCILAAMAIFCLLSLAMIFGKPSLGLHTAANGSNVQHVGAWRGLLAHKNDFGRLAAYAAVLFVIAGFTRKRWRFSYFMMALLALGMVAGSRSGQAVVLFALPLVAIAGFVWMKTLTPQFRALALVLFFPFVGGFTFIAGVVATALLEALGKDATLTGRTDIWLAVWRALEGHYLFGGGYGSGWNIVTVKVQVFMGWATGTLSHAHNGYLDLMTDIGIVGVVITVFFYLWTFAKVFKTFMMGGNAEFAALGVATLVFCLAGNWVGSFLLSHNSIFWVVTVMIFCKISQTSEKRYYRYQPAAMGPPGVGVASLPGRY